MNLPLRSVFVLTALLSAGVAHAGMYKCQVNGHTRFQDQPCPGSNSSENQIQTDRNGSGGAAKPGSSFIRGDEAEKICALKYPAADSPMRRYCPQMQADAARWLEDILRSGDDSHYDRMQISTCMESNKVEGNNRYYEDYVKIQECVRASSR